ncbi:MAG: hypothetical protein P4L99_29195 [Chthoniobacter sp.]|nr:hypothetical protein [Chthoniobacter sp.]
MNLNATPPDVRASDPVAWAVEEHLHKMEADGLGRLVVDRDLYAVRLTFGSARARGENYDIALVRLAGEILNDPRLAEQFLSRIRGSVDLASQSPNRRRNVNTARGAPQAFEA